MSNMETINLQETQQFNEQQQQNETKPLLKSKKSTRPDYLNELNMLEKLANQKIINDMNKRINFLRNPRFKVNRAPIQYKTLEKNPELTVNPNVVDCPFRASPEVVVFKDYMINQIYTIPLTITNVQNISRRFKYLPPQSEQFTISNIKYPIAPPRHEYEDDPNKEYGIIAPGMSVQVDISFNSTSFAEFEDRITIICDENVFEIPIMAKKELPSINLPQLMDCKSCWLGDKAEMVFRVKNKGGEAGFKFFCESEEDDAKQQDSDSLKLNNFTIYPQEFFIEKNKEVEIYVTYYPANAGSCQENVILACDNQTSAIYTLQGKANTAELQVQGIDGRPYSMEESFELGGIQKIFFNDVVPYKQVNRSLQIENKTQVQVKFHWALSKNDRKQSNFDIQKDEDFVFKIEPQEGYFEPDQVIDFQIFVKTNDNIPIFEFATLFIDDIPYSSIKNPPESLKQQLEEEKEQLQKGKNHEMAIKQPAYFGINSTRPSISYFEFELVALSDYCQIEINPSVQIYPQSLYINKQYTHKFLVKNKSKCPVDFGIREHKTSSWEVDSYLPEQKGTLEPQEEREIEVGFSTKKVGKNQKISYIIDYNFAHSQAIELIGNFIGPHIKLMQPDINFGLFKSFSSKTQTIQIQNISEVNAELEFFLESQNENNLDTISSRSLQEEEPDEFLWENAYDKNLEKEKPAKIKFFPKSLMLAPGETNTVEVTCEAHNPITYKDLARIEVKDGGNYFSNIFAEIQDIHVTLNKFSLDFDCLYAGNEYSFQKGQDEQYIELQNLGNLPTKFKWNPIDNEQYSVEFEPAQGEIPPKNYFPVQIILKPKLGGKFSSIFICDILDAPDKPLGFEIDTNILGLSVEYDKLEYLALPEQNSTLALDKKIPGSSKFKSTFLQKTLKKTLQNTQNTEQSVLNQSTMSGKSQAKKESKKKYKTEPLDKLNFYGCLINQVKTTHIMIKNTSGIDTQYCVYPEQYMPYLENYEQGFEDKTANLQKTDKNNESKIKFASALYNPNQTKTSYRKTGGKSIRPQKLPVLITADIEKKNNFTSVQGQQLNAAKRLERDQRSYLSNNLGIAVLCEPYRGDLPAYGEVVIKISVFNDICGLFNDKLCCHIKGMPVKKFDIDIEVTGTPVVVKPNQLGISYKGDFPLFHLGYYMRNSTQVLREFRIQNTGPKHIEIEWKIYNLSHGTGEDQSVDERNYFNIEVGAPVLGSSDLATLHFNPIEPPEATDGPFYIDTSKHMLSGRKDEGYKIQFKSDVEGVFNAVIVAKPKLIENPDVKVGLLAMYLRVETIQPNLFLDKYFTVEGTQKLKFEKWALAQNKKETKKFVLINQKPANILMKIEVFGPFKIVQAITNSPAKYELLQKSMSMQSSKGLDKLPDSIRPQSRSKLQRLGSAQQQEVQTAFNLVPNSNVEIKLQFEGPDVNDYEHWPMVEKEYKFGGINVFYSNGDEQNIDLEGKLIRPAIHLNTVGHEDFIGNDVQDFGLVHINNKKTISVYLSNKAKVPATWKLKNIKIVSYKNISDKTQTILEQENAEKCDDPDVFEFSVTSGTLYGPSVPVKSMPDTSALPGHITNQDIAQQNLFPQQILINFRPKKNILYKSKFRITVEQGPYVEIVLKGRGTYEEDQEQY